MVRRDLGVDIVTVVGTIADEGRHGTVDLLEQSAQLVTRCFCLGMWCRRAVLALNGK
ncbi:hypothetical protein [Paracraurococcus lichenis]|uniref:Uncharacterized protein n=1 Tax=Paracraurococcus lichenis TaxID=3064888 RepID=A0ABT9E2N7_9PROT|nr:hypothetical protein [Paracraurococcus sp. LOR1-02]MDO9710414.1 hypothetical protein [Paracraurococcus sp. LOR1-02]